VPSGVSCPCEVPAGHHQQYHHWCLREPEMAADRPTALCDARHLWGELQDAFTAWRPQRTGNVAKSSALIYRRADQCPAGRLVVIEGITSGGGRNDASRSTISPHATNGDATTGSRRTTSALGWSTRAGACKRGGASSTHHPPRTPLYRPRRDRRAQEPSIQAIYVYAFVTPPHPPPAAASLPRCPRSRTLITLSSLRI
jgi:hypothetical protein